MSEREHHRDSPSRSNHLFKPRFGDVTAVQEVDLTLAAGQFFGFLGPNDAAKSTTIKMLTELLAPTSGGAYC